MKIFYISPYSIEKNISGAINDAIIQLNTNDEDWICLTDGDAMFLTPDYGRQIHGAIQKFGHEYQLIGCLTNRLYNDYQLAPNMFDEMDLKKHYRVAERLYNQHGHEVVTYNMEAPIAGFFMLFSVAVWKSVGGFRNNSCTFDIEFTQEVRIKGGKVGIMPGLYMLHAYRLWAKDRQEARGSVWHLLNR